LKPVFRMCFICRNKFNKNEMLRLVKNSQGDIALDKTGKMDGRGAYICKCGECLNKIKNRKILNKAFKCEFPEEIYKKLCEDLIV